MSDVLIVGDVHLSDKPPTSRTSSYTEEILAKLQWCVEHANELSVPLVQAGDLFHIKTPSRTSHWLVQAVHDILKKAKHGVWIVPGNHDLYGDNLASLASQPLGTLSRMGNVRLLMGWDTHLLGVFGVPYLSAFDGGDWGSALDDFMNNIQEQVQPLLVTHAPLFPIGSEPGVYASISPEEWARYWGDDVVATYYGHIHDSHGIYEFGGMKFANHGAISRGSLHEATINRWPTVTLWSGGDFQPVPLPESVVKPPEQVFLFKKAAEKAAAKSSAEAFTNALGQVELEALTVEEVLSHVGTQTDDASVLQQVAECIEVATA